MGLQETIATVGGRAAVGALAKRFGLDEQTTAKAIDALLPAITGGIQSNLSQKGGAESLLDALERGGHSKYLEQPETLAGPEATQDGNGILGHVLGNKDVSRAVAGKAAAALGIDEGIAKQILPVVATMAMGGLARQTEQKRAAEGGGANLAGELGSMLGGGDLGSLLGKLF